MAGVPNYGVSIQTCSGELVAAVAADTDEVHARTPFPSILPAIVERDGDTESADSDSGSDSDAGRNSRGGGSRRRRAPTWHRQRKDIF